MSKPATITIDELSEILRAARHTMDVEATHGYKGAFSSQSQLPPQVLEALHTKLTSSSLTHYLGTVNAGALLGFEAMESGYPLESYWTTLVVEYQMKGPEKEATQAADAMGRVRAFLEGGGYIRKTD